MKRVITYGTFDLFHEGHYNILKRARALGDYLIVGVTSESYDIERGKLNVRDSLLKRIENVRRTGFADEIIIEEYQGQKLSDIIKYKVDLLVLGSDWRGKFDYLKNYCDVKYLERTKNISSTKLRGEGITYTVGVVTDDDKDNGIVWETKYVSGLHVECVFSENEEAAKSFCDKYELDSYYCVGADTSEWEQGFDCFLSQVDMVYIKTDGGIADEVAYSDVKINGTNYHDLGQSKLWDFLGKYGINKNVRMKQKKSSISWYGVSIKGNGESYYYEGTGAQIGGNSVKYAWTDLDTLIK